MWDFLTRLLWLPFDIIQRMSQRVFHLGRSIYGGLFGLPSKPALKPPSTTVSPNGQRSAAPLSTSVKPTCKLDNLSEAATYTSHCVIQMDAEQSSREINGPVLAGCAVEDLELKAFNRLAEVGTVAEICNVELLSSVSVNSKKTTADPESDVVPQNVVRVSAEEACTLQSGNVDVVEQPTNKATELTTGSATTGRDTSDCTLLGSHADAALDHKNKRLHEKQKRRQVIKPNCSISSNDCSVSDNVNLEAEGSAVVADDFQIQPKKPKLSDESGTSSLHVDSGEVGKRAKKRRSKKNKQQASGANEDNNMVIGRGPPPNFFIAIQISNRDIISKIAHLQRTMSERKLSQPWHDLWDTEIFKDAMVPVAKLHFTLHVMHLKGPEDIEKAQTALAECGQEVHQEFVNEPMNLTIEGLGHFKNNVIFAQIKDKGHIDRLTRISNLFRKKFTELNIPVDPRPFNPHMTIAKISRSNKLYKRKIRSFPPDMWMDLCDANFGVQRVTSLQLLQMAGEDKATGYYNCLGQYYFEDPVILNNKPENKL